MPIQYDGGVPVNTLTAGATTTTLLVDFIKDQLVAAGWTVVSGASGDWVLDCVLTAQGNRVRIRVFASGACAQILCRKVNDTQAQTFSLNCLPGVAWRIIAHRHQFFAFVPGTPLTRQAAFVSALYLPTDILSPTPNPVIVAQANAISDVDTTGRQSYRTQLSALATGMRYVNYNGVFGTTSVSLNSDGDMQFCVGRGQGKSGSASDAGQQWEGGAWVVEEPIIAFDKTMTDQKATRCGLIWNAFITTEARALDSTITFDGRTFFTVGGLGPTGNNVPKGSLMVAVT